MDILLKKELKQILKKVLNKVRSLKKVLKKVNLPQKGFEKLILFTKWIKWEKKSIFSSFFLQKMCGGCPLQNILSRIFFN